MPITSFTIGGDEVNCLYDSFDIRHTNGAVSTFSCDIISTGSPVTRFSVFSSVVVEEDGVKIFSGTVKQVRESGFGAPNLYDPVTGAPQIVTRITAEDHFDIGERKTVTLTIADGTTLEDALTALVAELSALDVTLHPSQATGPTLPAMTFTSKRASEVIQAFTDATGWLSRIDYDKQLRMFDQGELTAPFNIDEFDDPPRWTGDVEVENILGDDYANRVIVIVKLPEQKGRIERFDGDDVTATFSLQYTLIRSFGIIHRYEDDDTIAGGETFGIKDVDFDSDGNPTQWWYDPATNMITRNIGPTEEGFYYALTFDGFFTAEGFAEDAVAIADPDIGLYELVIENPDGVDTQEAADALAAAVLAERLLAGEQKIAYETRFKAPGSPYAPLQAGQLQTITATARDLAGDYIITDLEVRAETPVTATYEAVGLGLIWRVSAKKHNPMGGRYQDTYRDWLERGGTGTTSIGDAGPSGAGPAPPLESIQYHHVSGGKFGGNAALLFKEEFRAVTLGIDHSAGGDVGMLIGVNHTAD